MELAHPSQAVTWHALAANRRSRDTRRVTRRLSGRVFTRERLNLNGEAMRKAHVLLTSTCALACSLALAVPAAAATAAVTRPASQAAHVTFPGVTPVAATPSPAHPAPARAAAAALRVTLSPASGPMGGDIRHPQAPPSSPTPRYAKASPPAVTTRPTSPGCRPPTPPPPSAPTPPPCSAHPRYPPTSKSAATSTTPPKAPSTPSSNPPPPATTRSMRRGQGSRISGAAKVASQLDGRAAIT